MEIDINMLRIQNDWWEGASMIFDPDIKKVINSNIVFEQKTAKKIKLNKNSRIMLEGSHGTGKTTILKQFIKELIDEKKVDPRDILYYSCHNLISKEQLNLILKTFVGSRNKSNCLYIFLDEISKIKNWQNGIEYLENAKILQNTCIIASSSKYTKLENLNIKTPWKRHLIHSLSFGEVLNILNPDFVFALEKNEANFIKYQDKLNYYLDVYLLTGGFLESINGFSRDASIPQETYYNYIYWLLSELGKLKRDSLLGRQIFEQIFGNFGSSIGYKTIAKKTIAKTHNTVSDYLAIFENLFIVQVLCQGDLGGVANKRAGKKIYFRDPFIYWAMSSYIHGSLNSWKFSRDRVLKQEIFDELIENLVFSHLLKSETIETWQKSLIYQKIQVDKFFYISGSDYIYLDYYEKFGRDVFEKAKIKKGILITKSKLDLKGNIKKMPLFYFLLKQRNDN